MMDCFLSVFLCCCCSDSFLYVEKGHEMDNLRCDFCSYYVPASSNDCRRYLLTHQTIQFLLTHRLYNTYSLTRLFNTYSLTRLYNTYSQTIRYLLTHQTIRYLLTHQTMQLLAMPLLTSSYNYWPFLLTRLPIVHSYSLDYRLFILTH